MFAAVAKIVFEMVALIFQGIERFVFNFPAGTARFDQLCDIMLGSRFGRSPSCYDRSLFDRQ